MIENARTRGYAIELVYVGTADVAINLERIRQRVAAGGHDVPEADVVRRAKRSFEHAPEIVPLADNIAVFDNSGDEMLLIVTLEDGVVSEYRHLQPGQRRSSLPSEHELTPEPDGVPHGASD